MTSKRQRIETESSEDEDSEPEVENTQNWHIWKLWDKGLFELIEDHLSEESSGALLSRLVLSRAIINILKRTRNPITSLINLKSTFRIFEVKSVNKVNKRLKIVADLFRLANNEDIAEDEREWSLWVEDNPLSSLLGSTLKEGNLLIVLGSAYNLSKRNLKIKSGNSASNPPILVIFDMNETSKNGPRENLYGQYYEDFEEDVNSLYYKMGEGIVQLITPFQTVEPLNGPIGMIDEISDEEDDDNLMEVEDKGKSNDEEEVVQPISSPKRKQPSRGVKELHKLPVIQLETQDMSSQEKLDDDEEPKTKKNKSSSEEEALPLPNSNDLLISELGFKETQEQDIIEQGNEEEEEDKENINKDESSEDSDGEENEDVSQNKIIDFCDLRESKKSPFIIKCQILDFYMKKSKNEVYLSVTDSTTAPFQLKEFTPTLGIKAGTQSSPEQMLPIPSYDILVRNGQAFQDRMGKNEGAFPERESVILGPISIEEDGKGVKMLVLDGNNFNYKSSARPLSPISKIQAQFSAELKKCTVVLSRINIQDELAKLKVQKRGGGRPQRKKKTMPPSKKQPIEITIEDSDEEDEEGGGGQENSEPNYKSKLRGKNANEKVVASKRKKRESSSSEESSEEDGDFKDPPPPPPQKKKRRKRRILFSERL